MEENRKEIKLEDVFNDKKRENIKKFIDEIKNPSEPNQALKDADERLKGKELFKESNDRARKILSEIKSLPIQETLEEAAERFVENTRLKNPKSLFCEGAKWQQERSYSEEEVRKLLQSQRGNCYVAILTKTRDTELASFATLAPEPGGKDGWVKQSKKK
jgi:hypothetical protein